MSTQKIIKMIMVLDCPNIYFQKILSIVFQDSKSEYFHVLYIRLWEVKVSIFKLVREWNFNFMQYHKFKALYRFFIHFPFI